MFQSTLNLISQCYILCPRVVFSFQFAKVFIIVMQLNSILAVFKKYIHFSSMQFFMTLLHTCTIDIQFIPFHHPKISNNLINHNHNTDNAHSC